MERVLASPEKTYGPEHAFVADLLKSDAVVTETKSRGEAGPRSGSEDPGHTGGRRPESAHLERSGASGGGGPRLPAIQIGP